MNRPYIICTLHPVTSIPRPVGETFKEPPILSLSP